MTAWARTNLSKDKKGFSLTEVLVTVLIIGILASISVPIYLNQRTKAYAAAASADGKNIASEINSLASSYTSFGTSGSITLNTTSGLLSLNAGTGYQDAGVTAGIPQTSTTTIKMSGSSIGQSVVTPSTTNWCITVVNRSATVVYNQDGLQTDLTSCS